MGNLPIAGVVAHLQAHRYRYLLRVNSEGTGTVAPLGGAATLVMLAHTVPSFPAFVRDGRVGATAHQRL